MRKLFAVVLTAMALAVVAAVGPPAVAASASGPRAPQDSALQTATVTVLHGVPGVTVDVYANGEKVLSNVGPGVLSAPLRLPGGGYDIKIFKAGENPGGTPLARKTVTLSAGSNDTIAAHLSRTGSPMITAFVNDTSAVPSGQARVTLRHIAAAPAVDVRADGRTVATNLSNPGQAEVQLPAGTVSAEILRAGTGDVVLGVPRVPIAAGTNVILYAWGSADQHNLALAVQTIVGP
ncbi:DUF4397 domain-containing protein [Actinomadura viridis]|uniref:DUF4397 domain-containing protein n=1 Tax=Actinomadura viridis TaxID=58110 RepID=A0A931DPH3_9ACTN|nr:DUF4397 domain-containing protein [Actinomadura viridis]MBG6090368.1 hypothetical protein [Actinomadura viridis]